MNVDDLIAALDESGHTVTVDTEDTGTAQLRVTSPDHADITIDMTGGIITITTGWNFTGSPFRGTVFADTPVGVIDAVVWINDLIDHPTAPAFFPVEQQRIRS